MATIGEAFIEVHADTKPFDRELDSDLEQVTKRSEKSLERTGKEFGDKITDSMGTRIRQRGRDIGRSIERATRNVIVRVRSIFRFDRQGFRRAFRRDIGDSIADEVGAAFDRPGALNRVSEAVADAVGAGFNVSGRSPLIAILVPAILAIGGLIVALLQAVNALVAVLFLIPNLLGAIGLQVGVVAIAFQGMGTAIQGAFAAKNAKELRLALRDLTPSAREFVKSLLPLRTLFDDLRRIIQERFFAQLGGVIQRLQAALSPTLIRGFGDLADAMGRFFAQFSRVLASPQFVQFLNDLFDVTREWILAFGKSLFGKRGFLQGLIAMGKTLMPFMETFGALVLAALDIISELMFRFAESPDTEGWLYDMARTLQDVINLTITLGAFLFQFLKGLNEAGGAEVIQLLNDALQELILFLASPLGQKAMEGIVDLAKIGIASFTGLLIAILAVIGIFEALAEALRSGFLPAIAEAVRIFIQAVINAATFLGVWIERIVRAIASFFVWLWGILTTTKNNFSSLVKGAVTMASSLVAQFKAIPGKIISALGNLGGLLFGAGRSLLQGLINGVRNKINELLGLLDWIADRIAGVFGNSPAIYGPLKGRGWTLYRGQNIMEGLIEGIESRIPALREATMNATSNIVFGRDSVQVNFQGAPPTETQARTVGGAVGQGAANFLAARNTRLAVRTL